MWYYITAVIGAAVGFGTFALFAINRENREIRRLREFARRVIRQECWSISDLDGGDIQEWAEKLKLIVPHIATKDDIDDECDYEVGDTIFKFSNAMKGE